ncbi:MAG: hypothetical protein ACHQHO_12375 [Solirubrobacterales bacterium]
MNRIGLSIAVATATVLALGAVATSAWATKPPHWQSASKTYVCLGALFAKYEDPDKCANREYSPAIFGVEALFGLFEANKGTPKELKKAAQKITNSKESVECTAVEATGGLFDLEEETSVEQGRSVKKLTYSGCKVYAGEFKEVLTGCKVTSINGGKAGESGVIKMEAEGELVFLGSNKEAAEKNTAKIGELSIPAGEAAAFATLDFTGIGCSPIGESELTGSTLSEVEKEGKEEEWDYLVLPSSALTTCFKWTSKGLVTCEGVGLKLFGTSTVESGETGIRLETKEKFGAFQ